MSLADLYQNDQFGLSIEIFPPKTEAGENTLRKNLKKLIEFQPAFVSCTYGAGGTTQAKTLEWCAEIKREYSIPVTAHFTCVGSTTDDLKSWLKKAESLRIDNIMALRGDPPDGETSFQAVEGGFTNANQLVELIHSEYPQFGIGVAGYPEKHPEASDMKTDLINLKRKVDAGAGAIYTQLFFVNDNFYRFREQAVEQGIEVPIIPGIMPITEFSRIQRITSMCGTDVPDGLGEKLEAVKDDSEAQFEIGVEFAIQQCQDLIDHGVPGIHFYVLNKCKASEQILNALGIPQKN